MRPRVHTGVLAVDICSFGRLGRDNRTQLYLRETLYGLLTQAFGSSGISWENSHHEDRGDGVLVVLAPNVPIEELLDLLIERLARGLRDHNRRAAEPGLRLRLAAHCGLVVRDDHGVAGATLTHLYRLLDAQALRKAIAASRTDLGVIISDRLHDDAIDHGGLADPSMYRRVRVHQKETRTSAWLRIPSEAPGSACSPSGSSDGACAAGANLLSHGRTVPHQRSTTPLDRAEQA